MVMSIIEKIIIMYVTRLEFVTEVKLLQPAKVCFPMLVTLLGIVTEVKLLQRQKA